MIDREKVINGLNDIGGFIAGRVGFEQAKNFMQTIDEAVVLLKEKETVEHACDILRANGWKETEPLCSECDAVHVVMCKDCRWGDRSRNGKGEEMILCYNGDTGIEDGYLHEPDWYCADGERKEGR